MTGKPIKNLAGLTAMEQRAGWLQSPFAEALDSLAGMMADETGQPREDCTQFWEEIVWNAQRAAASRAKGGTGHATLIFDPMAIVAAEILGYLKSGDPKAVTLFAETSAYLMDAEQNFARDPAASHPRFVIAQIIGMEVQALPDDEEIPGLLGVAKLILALVGEVSFAHDPKMWAPVVRGGDPATN